MIKFVLLTAGLLLLVIHQYVQPISIQLQFISFLVGIVLLGVPHGAADLLVASQHATDEKKHFSTISFFSNYLGRLFLFAIILWLFPLLGMLLFVFFAAYHFGETDLHQFKTNTIVGKFLIVSYGLVILGFILLNHFEDAKPLFRLFNSSGQYLVFIDYLEQYRFVILAFCGLSFLVSSFFYFLKNRSTLPNQILFLAQFTFILFVLYHLPMLLGFTFYFIVWHSVLSLSYIVGYLRKDGLFSKLLIVKQISFYSLLAITGVVCFGLTGFMFINNNAMIVYVFLGLAVLTAPHMQIMHNMYNTLRSYNTIAKGA